MARLRLLTLWGRSRQERQSSLKVCIDLYCMAYDLSRPPGMHWLVYRTLGLS